MLQLLPNRVHLSGQPSFGCVLYPLIDQVKQFTPEVGGAAVAHHQKIGQLLARTLHKEFLGIGHFAAPGKPAILAIREHFVTKAFTAA